MTPQNLPEPDDQEQSNRGGKLIQQARSALETSVTNVSNKSMYIILIFVVVRVDQSQYLFF